MIPCLKDWNILSHLTSEFIKKFEEKSGIPINVYTLDEKDECVNSAYVSDNHEGKDRVNLLFLKKKDCECDKQCSHINYKYHYCWIKNLRGLIKTQLNHTGSDIYICDRCVSFSCRSPTVFSKHIKDCKRHDPLRINLPTEGVNILK